MSDPTVTFMEMDDKGNIVSQREIRTADILACGFAIMDPHHYREDGSCRCDDPEEQKRLIDSFDYTPEDFDGG